INSKPYYFAVTAFTSMKGFFNKRSESEIVPIKVIPKSINPGIDFSTSITKTEQFAIHSKGKADSTWVKVEVINPLYIKDKEYKVTFHKDKYILKWSLLCDEKYILINQDNISGDYNYPVFDGIITRVKALGKIKTFRKIEIKPGSKLKFGGDGYTIGFLDGLAKNIWGGGNDYIYYYGNDLEIRFTSKGSYASEYNELGNNNSFTGIKWVPYEIWDIENNIQLNSVYYDNYPYNGEWKIKDEDYIIVINKKYNKNEIYKPNDPTATWLFYFSKESEYETGDWTKIFYDNPVIPGEDEFTFKTYSPIINDENHAKTVFKNKVRAIPNPYYGNSRYEAGNKNRKIMFSPLPEKCTIRIFTLYGILIRTLKKESSEPHIFWDLKNDYGMEITSGVYIYIIESEKLGKTIGKIAVFMDERF
ncbi:hypothetical protein DRQ09_10485, partial [candidate division KSB1 bacterium]